MGWFYLPSPRLDLKLLLFRTKLISWNGDTFLSASSLFFWSSSGVYCIFVKPISKSYLFVLTFISVSLQSRSSRSSSSRKWLLFKTGATECQPNSGDLERPLFVAADWRNLPTNNGPEEELWKKYFFPSPKKCDTCSHFHAVSFIGNGDDVVSHFFKRMYCIRFFKKIEGNQWNSSTFLFQPELHPPEKIVWYVISNAILQSLP